MAPHSEHCSAAAVFAERIFQQLEDNRPSDAPADFSNSLSKKSKTVQPKATESISQQARNTTVGSSDVYTQSEAGSMGNSHVQQLVASYEARSRQTEELALKTARRKHEATASEHLSPQDSTLSLRQDNAPFCPDCAADNQREWIKVIHADLD
ncbi:hypothetical protein CI238_10803 [Colletotrichum incanum]|uniref:Uncharacterized protein n=1 Tax=Colletotrichum incanum TaxID=1573173 RepID=A0A167BU75_COLIC|nr:hypothetical protein CI238_10803 [Colletotrichum incanum]